MSLADLRKDNLKEQIRGNIMKNVILEVAKSKAEKKYWKYLKNPEQVARN
jgi:hypothetical protein